MYLININKSININYNTNWIKFNTDNKNIIKKKYKYDIIFLKKNKLYIFIKQTKNNNINFYYNIMNTMQYIKNKFILKIRLIGIGYKINIKNDILTIKLGLSHFINKKLPKGIDFNQPKNKVPIYCIIGNDLRKITQFAANIRDLKKPEPYKGKGFRYYYEKIKRKEGKKNYV